MLWLTIIAIMLFYLSGGSLLITNLLDSEKIPITLMSQVSAQIKSRWDALTNLITATKNYQTYENKTLTKII